MTYSRLKNISTRDNVLFKYNSDIMNKCFGGNYSHYFNDPTKEVYGGCVWFPKERVKDKNGNWQPGSKEVNWKNYITDDGDKIYMYLNPGETAKESVKELPVRITEAVPHHVFMKSERFGGYYKYVGTFLPDINASTGAVRLYRLLNNKLDLSLWYNYENEGYYDVDGNPSYERLYLGGSFQEHKRLISEFKAKATYDDFETVVYEFSEKYSIPKIIRLGEKSFRADFIKGLINVIKIVYGKTLTVPDLYPNIMAFQDIGSSYVNLIMNSDDYNKTICDSFLGEQIAGMVKGIYDSYYYIYGMDIADIDLCIKKLGFSNRINENRMEKCCLLYFWKQCMSELFDWSIPYYISFLKSL